MLRRLYPLFLSLLLGLAAPAALAQPVSDTVAVPSPEPPPAVPPAEQAAVPAEPVQEPAAGEPSAGVVDTLRTEVLRLQQQVDALERALDVTQDSLAALEAARANTPTVQRAVDTVNEVAREAQETVRNLGYKVFLSLLLIALVVFVLRALVAFLEALAGRSAARRLFYKRLIPVTRLTLWALAVYLIVDVVFRVPAGSLLAALAAIGVGVAFAAQDLLKNIFGGLVIVFDQPFQVGDKISVGGTYGEVISIGLRSTRITTPDDNLVSVPNSQVVDSQVANANAGALDCQVVTDLYLPGWVDVALAKRIAYEAAANSKYVYLDKPIVVICKDEVNETFLLHLKVKAYVLDTRYEFLLMSDVTEAAKTEFLRRGLLTPMPLRPLLGGGYAGSDGGDGEPAEGPAVSRRHVAPGTETDEPEG